jgi:hypothetical protein
MVKLKRVLAAVKIRTYLKNLIMKTAFVIIKIQNFKMDSLFKFEQVRSARDAREKDTIVEEKGKAVISQEVGGNRRWWKLPSPAPPHIRGKLQFIFEQPESIDQ